MIRKALNDFRSALELAMARPRRMAIPALLCGGEGSLSARDYAHLTGNPMRPSMRISDGPHVAFLREYAAEGEAVFAPGRFERTRYYANAVECMDALGSYFPSNTRPEEIHRAARRFVRQFLHGEEQPETPGHSPKGSKIMIRPVPHSRCFEVVDGNHRIAAAVVRGDPHVIARPLWRAGRTPLQEQLLSVLWQNSRRELYQPVPFPEVADWPIVRRCEDRLAWMLGALATAGVAGGSYLDIGSSYGWFPAQFAKLGFDAFGIERDPAAIRVGAWVYGFPEQRVTRGDLVRALEKTERRHDVVSFFSVLHHFVMGRGLISAEALIKRVDRVTNKVLFFDTGQCHEKWFRQALAGWDADHIESWLRRETTFRRIIRLGIDGDARPPYHHNYGRTLFACVR